MPILTNQQYTANRVGYHYAAPHTVVNIVATAGVGPHASVGIFPGPIPGGAISIRQFESLIQSVFNDYAATPAPARTLNHLANLQSISLAIVHWKMASQGGRADRAANNVQGQWNQNTATQLMNAYNFHAGNPIAPDVGLFQIGGVRIATASAFLRFLFPWQYGIVDSRVAGLVTNPNGDTSFNLRQDNYINDTQANRNEYNTVYVPLLQAEAAALNAAGVTFIDPDPAAARPQNWRPCDIEMALW